VTPRKVVQIAAMAGGDSVDKLYALANDGTVWVLSPNAYEPGWFPVPPVPQSEPSPAEDVPPVSLADVMQESAEREPWGTY
jgi:hypothetical protein